MKLQIVERTEPLFSGEVSTVVVPAYHGELGILPGHTPLLAVLEPGTTRFTTLDGEEHRLPTGKGFITLDDDDIVVVVDPR